MQAPRRTDPPLLSLRVHPSIAAAFLITLTLGAWDVLTTARENDLAHAGALDALRERIGSMEARQEKLRDEFEALRERVRDGRP